jgi:hypothetical protein
MQHTATSPAGRRPTILLPVELTPDGIEQARQQLHEIEGLVGGTPRAPTESAGDPNVVTLYKHAGSRSRSGSQTPHLLRLFAQHPSLLTPAEIAIEMGRPGGEELSKATVRAYLRNLSRTQGHLLKVRKIRREVLLKDDSRLAEEGAKRYGLSPEDRDELRSYLGYKLPARGLPA